MLDLRRPALASVMMWCLSASVSGQVPAQPLASIDKVTARAALSSEQLPVGINEDRLQTLLELRLRTAGLRVLSAEENRADPDVNPIFYLSMILMDVSNQAGTPVGYAFATTLEVLEYTIARRNAAIVPMELWSHTLLNVASTDAVTGEVERVVHSVIDRALNDWLRANPPNEP